MFNGVLLVAIIATWILKVTSLPKLYYKCHLDYEAKVHEDLLIKYHCPSFNKQCYASGAFFC